MIIIAIIANANIFAASFVLLYFKMFSKKISVLKIKLKIDILRAILKFFLLLFRLTN